MLYTLENPVFAAYVLAAALSVFKLMGQGWVTVYWLMRKKAGYASPEDIAKGPTNPDPHPSQLDPDPDVERSRRMHRNDLENIPGFAIAGALLVAADPPFVLASGLFAIFVLARAGHAWAYGTAKSHETRAAFYTSGSISVTVMAAYALIAAAAAL